MEMEFIRFTIKVSLLDLLRIATDTMTQPRRRRSRCTKFRRSRSTFKIWIRFSASLRMVQQSRSPGDDYDISNRSGISTSYSTSIENSPI